MDSQVESKKMSIPRLMVGVGFFLLLGAVVIGAATSQGGGNLPKYLAGVAVATIAVGAIGSALQARLRRSS